MTTFLPKTPIQIILESPQAPVGQINPLSQTESIVFDGAVILDDQRGSQSQVFTEFGIEKKSGIILYLPFELDNLKTIDTARLKVKINKNQIASNQTSFVSANLLILRVKSLSIQGGFLRKHIEIICDV
jgi:hypothetical protein